MFLVLLMSAVSAFGSMNVIFAKGNSKGTLIFSGKAGEFEAWRLYDSLSAEPKDFAGKWSKILAHDNVSGDKAIRVSCVFSKSSLKEIGSCTLTVHAVAGALVDSSRQLIRYEAVGEEAARLAAGFHLGTESRIYASDNGRFSVDVNSREGVIQSVILEYK